MTKGEAFHHKTDNRLILSLGFHRWAFQALRLVAWKSMSDEASCFCLAFAYKNN